MTDTRASAMYNLKTKRLSRVDELNLQKEERICFHWVTFHSFSRNEVKTSKRKALLWVPCFRIFDKQIKYYHIFFRIASRDNWQFNQVKAVIMTWDVRAAAREGGNCSWPTDLWVWQGEVERGWSEKWLKCSEQQGKGWKHVQKKEWEQNDEMGYE